MTSSEKILTILLIASRKRMTILILELYSLLSVLTALTPKTKIPIRTPDITLPPQNHNPSLILQIQSLSRRGIMHLKLCLVQYI